MIFSAFLFTDEVELAIAKIIEEREFVDRFIVLEAGQYFTGQQRDPVWPENASFIEATTGVKPFWHFSPTLEGDGPWEREAFLRDSLLFALYRSGIHKDDTLIFSDGDEIVDISTFAKCEQKLESPVTVLMPCYMYNLSWRASFDTYRTNVTKFGPIVDIMPSQFADTNYYDNIVSGGWHLTSFFTPERLSLKIKTFSHQELNNPDWASVENCKRLIEEGIDIAPERPRLSKVDPSSGPRWLVENDLFTGRK